MHRQSRGDGIWRLARDSYQLSFSSTTSLLSECPQAVQRDEPSYLIRITLTWICRWTWLVWPCASCCVSVRVTHFIPGSRLISLFSSTFRPHHLPHAGHLEDKPEAITANTMTAT